MKPGAFYVAIHHYNYPSENDLDLAKIFGYLANEAARTVMNDSAESVDDMVRQINRHLEQLKLAPFSLEEKQLGKYVVQLEKEEPLFPEI